MTGSLALLALLANQLLRRQTTGFMSLHVPNASQTKGRSKWGLLKGSPERERQLRLSLHQQAKTRCPCA